MQEISKGGRRSLGPHRPKRHISLDFYGLSVLPIGSGRTERSPAFSPAPVPLGKTQGNSGGISVLTSPFRPPGLHSLAVPMPSKNDQPVFTVRRNDPGNIPRASHVDAGKIFPIYAVYHRNSPGTLFGHRGYPHHFGLSALIPWVYQCLAPIKACFYRSNLIMLPIS